MRGRTGGMVAAALTALALFATACGGGGGSEPQPGTSQAGGQGGEISVRSGTPQNPLILDLLASGRSPYAAARRFQRLRSANSAPRRAGPRSSAPTCLTSMTPMNSL